MKNVFDEAFVIGYRDGYHGEAYDKDKFEKYSQPQRWIKYRNGWQAGFLSKVEEKEKA